MIPTVTECIAVWDSNDFPQQKRRHTHAVLSVARTLLDALEARGIRADRRLVEAAVMLHDIDKNVVKLPGERHPDASVRVVRAAGFTELERIIARHPLHMILSPSDAPSTLEERIVFLADKMAKYEPIGVDARFALWRAEDLPEEGRRQLEASYPRVLSLAAEVCALAGRSEADIIADAKRRMETEPI